MSKFAIMFLIVFFSGIGVALVYNGWAAFIVYELIYFLNPDHRWWSAGIPGLRYSFIVVLLMIGVLVIRYKEYSLDSPWMQQPALKWMGALLLMYFIAFSFALSMPQHESFTIDFTKLIIIVFIAYKLIDSEKALDASVWGYLIGAFYIGYLATVTGRNSGARLEGIGPIDAPDSNGTAATLVPAAVLLMYYAWQGNLKVKIATVILGAFIANGLVLINSRGSFLGVVVSLVVFLLNMIYSRHQKKGQRFTAIILIICGLAGAFYVTDKTFWTRMGTLKEVEDQDKQGESGANRTVFWFKTFDMLKAHPFGLGIWGYNKLAPIYMDDKTRGGVEFRSVHSSWFQGLGEIGYQGIVIFSLMIYSALKISRKAKRLMIKEERYNIYFKILALECALLGYLVTASFMNLFRSQILYWMILFLAVAGKLYYLKLQNPQGDTSMNEVNKRSLINGVGERE